MICKAIKEHCQKMIDTANSTLANEMEKMIPQFTQLQRELDELNDKISNEEWTLRFVIDAAKTVYETELIHLVNELAVYGSCLLCKIEFCLAAVELND